MRVFLISLFVVVGSGFFAFADGDAESLAAAIRDLTEKFGDAYPGGPAYLKRLENAGTTTGVRFRQLQREALLANPLLREHPILYVSRTQYLRDHHNTATMFQTGEINTDKYKHNEGGKLKAIDLATGQDMVIVDAGEHGCVRDPEVSFDGSKIVFSMRKHIDDDYHIYEVNADGSGLKALTSLPGVFDIDPLYLPDGDIAFTSSREPKYCMCNVHIMGNLYRMESDGANIHQIGKNTLFEGHGSLMPDGRILYDRWEYVDRNFGDAQGLWTMNPDGTTHAIYWGNNTGSPGAVLDGRIIPGTQLCVATLSSCHSRPWGAIGIIDRRLGVDGKQPIIRTWPESARNLVSVKGGYDDFRRIRPRYEDPYPLDRNYFLVSREIMKRGHMGIFLIDTFGNAVLLHKEARFGCFDPMPLAPRFKPPVKPLARDYENRNGTFYVHDVYIGTHMRGIERGDVKYLRVVESPPKRNWTHPGWKGQGVQRPAMNWHNFINKRILGTVPVEPDGSAYFECPSDTFVFFQLLDENKMMLQSMRSGTTIQSGEQQGCVGCHENRVEDVPSVTRPPQALQRRADKLQGWHGEPRCFGFQSEVQPVFDRHCVSCHDFGKAAGETLNLAGDRTIAFNVSYTDLWGKGFVNCIGAGPAEIQQPKAWGSHASALIDVVRNGIPENRNGHAAHATVKLSASELERLVTWVDINAPYYPTYDSAYPDGVVGRSPLTPDEVKQLESWTGARVVRGFKECRKAQVSFERPALSPCLAELDPDSDAYRQSLALIETGAQRLRERPRSDMVGFKPCLKDRERNQKFTRLREIEGRFREAIRKGERRYDTDMVE